MNFVILLLTFRYIILLFPMADLKNAIDNKCAALTLKETTRNYHATTHIKAT